MGGVDVGGVLGRGVVVGGVDDVDVFRLEASVTSDELSLENVGAAAVVGGDVELVVVVGRGQARSIC